MTVCEILIGGVCHVWVGKGMLYAVHQSRLWSHLFQDTAALTAPRIWIYVSQIPANPRALSTVKSWQTLTDVCVNTGTPARAARRP